MVACYRSILLWAPCLVFRTASAGSMEWIFSSLVLVSVGARGADEKRGGKKRGAAGSARDDWRKELPDVDLARSKADKPSHEGAARMISSDWGNEIPDVDLVSESARLSQLVYELDSADDPGWMDNGYTPIWVVDIGDETEMALVFKEDLMLLVFRGSDESDDWNANLDVVFSAYQPPDWLLPNVTSVQGQVHGGFYEKFFSNDYFVFLIMYLSDTFIPSFPDHKLVLTGHSQGAAMATLLGVFLAQRDPELPTTIINFGSPRVGDLDFKNSVELLPNLAHFRVVFEEDTVTRLPLESWGYHHVGHLIYKFEHNEEFKAYFHQVGDNGVNYDGISDYEWDIGVAFRDPGGPVSDHFMTNYESSLQLATSNRDLWPNGFQLIDRPANPECCRRLFGYCWKWCD